MKKNLIKYLFCPNCRKDLCLTDCNNGNEITTGLLNCLNCNESYPITNGVPIFVKNFTNSNDKLKLTAQNFAYSWQTFSRTNKDFYYKQFFDWINPVNEEFLKGKIVLDAGCGKGHHLLIISDFVKEAIGVDISDSVFVAYNHTKHLPNIHIIKADLNHLPLKDELFDYIYSIGVVHHTESPQVTTKNILQKVKKAGVASLWVYGRENNGWIIYLVDPARKYISTHFPLFLIHGIAAFLAMLLYPILKIIYLPVSRFKILQVVRKWLFYYQYLSYISRFDFIEIKNIIFDHLVAPISHYLTKQEVEDLTNSHSSKVKIEWHNQNSWRVLMHKS